MTNTKMFAVSYVLKNNKNSTVSLFVHSTMKMKVIEEITEDVTTGKYHKTFLQL